MDEPQKQPAPYITNKWLVSILAALVISMGSYIFKGIDKGNDVQANQISTLQKTVERHDIDIATIQTTISLNYSEIIRRLEKIEQQTERVERRTALSTPSRLSSFPPTPPGTWPNCKANQSSVRAANGEWFCQTR